MRRVKFQNGKYYHIYNRGVYRQNVFGEFRNYLHFLELLKEVNRPEPIESLHHLQERLKRSAPERFRRSGQPLVKIIAYNLLPNHFHLCLIQATDNGISKYMQKLSAGYTSYFNYKNKRNGSLFQGPYKSIEVKTDSYLEYLSAYINGNAEIHGIDKAENWPWSSCLDFIGKRNGTLCDKNPILSQFDCIADFIDYMHTVIMESTSRKDEIKTYLLE